MLIDSYTPKFSAQVTTTLLGADHVSIVDGLKSQLTDVGWTLTESLYAEVTLSFLGIPTRVATTPALVKPQVSCGSFPFIRFDGIRYNFYNPDNQTPVDSLTCVMVALGTTKADTLDNLAAAIKGGNISGLPFHGETIPGQDKLKIVCDVAGGRGNGWQVIPDGGWGTGIGVTEGGGWTLKSVEVLDSDLNVVTTQYSVSIRGWKKSQGNQVTPPSVYVGFDFNFNPAALTPQTAQMIIDSYSPGWTADGRIYSVMTSNTGDPVAGIGGYRVVANPYSFGIWDHSEDASHAPGWRTCSFFIAAPYIPTDENFVSTRSVVAIGSGLRGSTSYRSANHYTCLETANPIHMYSTGTQGGYLKLLATRSPGPSLKTPTGATLVTNAWIMYGRAPGSTPKVVGKFWDCVIVNDVIEESAMVDDKPYYRVSRQRGAGQRTASSLLFRVR